MQTKRRLSCAMVGWARIYSLDLLSLIKRVPCSTNCQETNMEPDSFMQNPMDSLFAGKLTFQVPPKPRWAHAGVMPEAMAELKFAGKTQLCRDVLDRQPIVSEQQSRLVQSRALDLFVDRSLAGFLK